MIELTRADLRFLARQLRSAADGFDDIAALFPSDIESVTYPDGSLTAQAWRLFG